jgi:S-adenosylmethionine uptake transporter
MKAHAKSAQARTSTESGMMLMAVTMLIVPGQDALAKLLTDTVSTGEIALSRFAFQSLFLAPIVLFAGARFRGRPSWLHAAGGALLGSAILMIVWSFKYMPIANAIAIFFVEPLILTLMSAVILRESVGWRRITAAGIGLGGALLVIRPNWSEFGWVAILPLFTAFCFASYLIVTRTLSQRGNRIGMQFWVGVFGAIFLGIVTLAGDRAGAPLLELTWPGGFEIGLMAAMGLMATVTHIMIATAFGMAQASILAPFQYMEIISATLLGLIIFGDFPDAVTWVGTAIIIASGLYVFHRERRLARTPVPDVPER